MNHLAVWIDDLLSTMEDNSNQNIISVIEACGEKCAHRTGMLARITELKTESSQCKNHAEIVQFLSKHLPGSITQVDDGLIIHAVEGKCSCKMEPENFTHSSMLCNCTKGYHKAIWSEFFGRPVEVEIIETILRGSNECIFKIII
ncbi:DUF6144 family protein [Methanolobus profundi]|uniref:Metanogen output domain-containing protein n=1 Tax=Methanolobus profundi TaxID=487685 RepID=A0A1I4UY49_9EURY|nr:DUF6144 family protein [Methanolobus profundi]SFM93904.1 hypothetical protein SAMN04488696_2941 [Methanolobus profundi]